MQVLHDEEKAVHAWQDPKETCDLIINFPHWTSSRDQPVSSQYTGLTENCHHGCDGEQEWEISDPEILSFWDHIKTVFETKSSFIK